MLNRGEAERLRPKLGPRNLKTCSEYPYLPPNHSQSASSTISRLEEMLLSFKMMICNRMTKWLWWTNPAMGRRADRVGPWLRCKDYNIIYFPYFSASLSSCWTLCWPNMPSNTTLGSFQVSSSRQTVYFLPFTKDVPSKYQNMSEKQRFLNLHTQFPDV